MANWLRKLFRRRQPVKRVIEVAVDASAGLLWIQPYYLRCIHKAGETFIMNSQTWVVVLMARAYEDDLVEVIYTVVRRWPS